MISNTYPISRAVKLARSIAEHCKMKFPAIFSDDAFHNLDYLTTFCRDCGIHLITWRSLPGTSKRAAVMFVQGNPFVILDKSLQIGSRESFLALAHEIGHIVMDHGRRQNFSAYGFSETIHPESRELEFLYHSELELEANLVGMMMVMPDPFLDKTVENLIWIPTAVIAEATGLPLDWVAARVQLYREMFGYKRSKELTAAKMQSEIVQNQGVPKECLALEFSGKNFLQAFLPSGPGKLSSYYGRL
jgi:Zn-dependent peptidase ImmA (M78 family)